MEDNYENIFGNLEGPEYYNLCREQSMEIDNIFCNSQGFYNYGLENDYELQIDNFKVDKSETKSNSKFPSPPHNNISEDIQNYLSKSEINTGNPTNKETNPSKIETLKIFNIEKDEGKRQLLASKIQSVGENNSSNSKQLTLSERMKYKKEKAKMMLGGKKKRDDGSEEIVCESSFSSGNKVRTKSNLSCNNDSSNSVEKVLRLNDNQDKFTKKQIKILRNRMSAQKSRDRKKQELEDLRIYSADLLNENNYLKNRLQEVEQELKTMKEGVKNCSNCSRLVDRSDKTELEVESNPRKNNTSTSVPLRTTVVDMSSASRVNYNNRMKLGFFSGFLLVLLILGCIILYPIEFSSQPNSQPRMLELDNLAFYLSNNKSLVPIRDIKSESIINEKSKHKDSISNKATKNSDDVSYPLALPFPEIQSYDENLLGRKRYEFMIRMANKIRVANSIQEIKTIPKKSLREVSPYYKLDNANKGEFMKIESSFYINADDDDHVKNYSLCLNEGSVSYETKNEPDIKSNYPVPYDYYDRNKLNTVNRNVLSQSDIRTMERLQNNVESILCKDFATVNQSKDHILEEAFKKKLEGNSSGQLENKSDDCLYLHMVLPSKENDKPVKKNKSVNELSDEAAFEEPKMKTYYEIGCKIFEINKIYK